MCCSIKLIYIFTFLFHSFSLLLALFPSLSLVHSKILYSWLQMRRNKLWRSWISSKNVLVKWYMIKKSQRISTNLNRHMKKLKLTNKLNPRKNFWNHISSQIKSIEFYGFEKCLPKKKKNTHRRTLTLTHFITRYELRSNRKPKTQINKIQMSVKQTMK